jgi:hypothetical protein
VLREARLLAQLEYPLAKLCALMLGWSARLHVRSITEYNRATFV